MIVMIVGSRFVPVTHAIEEEQEMTTEDTDGESKSEIVQLAINTIRTLAMDAVQQANSGHPGTPMALAPVVYCLWQRFLRFDPDHPIWPNRDRFVLSAGHASTLLYAMLHLTGVKAVNPKYEVLGELSVSLDDIKRFRQLDSKCPGHRNTAGPRVSRRPPARWGRRGHQCRDGHRRPLVCQLLQSPGFELFDYDVYALAGDGCMMEGISGEAASLAGTQARQPMLDLRQQSHHHRGQHGVGLQ